MLSNVPNGMLIQRVGCRSACTIAAAVYCVASLLGGTFCHNIYALMATRFVGGAAYSLLSVAQQTCAPRPPRRRSSQSRQGKQGCQGRQGRQGSQGRDKQFRPRSLARAPSVEDPFHRTRSISPKAKCLRRFPFGLADKETIRLGALPPVDAAGRIARQKGPKLPERIALAGPAAAMHALQHGARHPVGGDDERRQGSAERFRPECRGGRRGLSQAGPSARR
jgi:hypothetical protein